MVRELNDSIATCQVVGTYKTLQKENQIFGDTLIVANDYYSINKNIPVDCSFKDTLNFYLVVNRDIYKVDTISRIKVWNNN